MGVYDGIINQVLGIAEYLEKGQIAQKDIPLDDIIMLIKDIYDSKCEMGERFASLYGAFLTQSREETVLALKLFAEYLLVFEKYDALVQNIYSERENMICQLNEQNKKIWLLQSKLGYYVNCNKIRDWYTRNVYKKHIPFTGRGVVYSAIIGDYDEVKEPECVSRQFDYILFTNNPEITSNVWRIVLIDNPERLDNVRLARKIKIMGHEYLQGYDYSIWVDGKIKIKGDIQQYIETYKRNEPILCFNHYEKDCAYEEEKDCISQEKDIPEIIEKQMKRYRLEGYPEQNGLVDTGFMVRELHNERVKRVMETWWDEVLSGSRRDQLSFNYACWKNDFIYDTSDLFIYGNPYVEVYTHQNADSDNVHKR